MSMLTLAYPWLVNGASGLLAAAIASPIRARSLRSICIQNPNAAVAFIQVFFRASAPTVGTTVPNFVIPVAASSVMNLDLGRIGLADSTESIVYMAATTTATGSTALGAACVVSAGIA